MKFEFGVEPNVIKFKSLKWTSNKSSLVTTSYFTWYSLIWKIIKMQSFFKTHSDVIITALTKLKHLYVCNITNT